MFPLSIQKHKGSHSHNMKVFLYALTAGIVFSLTGPWANAYSANHTVAFRFWFDAASDPGSFHFARPNAEISSRIFAGYPLNLNKTTLGLGVFWDSDAVYFGLSDEGANRKDAILAWGDDSDDQFRFLFTGIEVMRLTPQRRLGLGTTTPDVRFHVYQEAGARIKVESGVDGLPGLELAESGEVKWFLLNDSTNDSFVFRNGPVTELADRMTISAAGNVGIGTSGSSHKLAVNGSIRAKEVIVDTGWADYVFEPGYALAPLAEVERHIAEKGHLPDVPSAAEVTANGISVGEAQTILLRKVEELTLHLIAQDKELARLRAQVDALTRPSELVH